MKYRVLVGIIVLLAAVTLATWLWMEGVGRRETPLQQGDAPLGATLASRVYEALDGTAISFPERPEVSVSIEKRTRSDGAFEYVSEYVNPLDNSDRASVSVPSDGLLAEMGTEGGKTWIVLPFYINYGGTGTFLYIGLFSFSDLGQLQYGDAVMVDDRVAPSSITELGPGMVLVRYLSRAPNEAMAAEPSLPSFIALSRHGRALEVIAGGINADTSAAEFSTPKSGDTTARIFTFSGQALPSWFANGTIQARVLDRASNPVGAGMASTTDVVGSPFRFAGSATVSGYQGPAILELLKANQGGNPKNDARIYIPIIIAP